MTENDPRDTGYVPPFIDFEDEEDRNKKKNKKEQRHTTVQIKRKSSLQESTV